MTRELAVEFARVTADRPKTSAMLLSVMRSQQQQQQQQRLLRTSAASTSSAFASKQATMLALGRQAAGAAAAGGGLGAAAAAGLESGPLSSGVLLLGESSSAGSRAMRQTMQVRRCYKIYCCLCSRMLASMPLLSRYYLQGYR